MDRIVVDLGNSRLKFGRVGPDRTCYDVRAHALDDARAIKRTIAAWITRSGPIHVTIASVNPPELERLLPRLGANHDHVTLKLLRNAESVRVKHRLTFPERTGVDRALAVKFALELHGGRGPGRVISCGTAITVETIDSDGTWIGGAITIGLGLAARALNHGTAQLPLITLHGKTINAWGGETVDAMAAGLFWGTVGSVREILYRQTDRREATPWHVWTGGDAQRIAPWLDGRTAHIAEDLVLKALAQLDLDADSP